MILGIQKRHTITSLQNRQVVTRTVGKGSTNLAFYIVERFLKISILKFGQFYLEDEMGPKSYRQKIENLDPEKRDLYTSKYVNSAVLQQRQHVITGICRLFRNLRMRS
jgi:hypothetical protein